LKILQRFFPFVLLALLSAIPLHAQTPQIRFEKQVLTYEAEDKTNPPPKNAILLVGDSQFYRWKTLAEDLPDFTIINRGIDSFQFSDILNYYDRLVTPYRPRMIIFTMASRQSAYSKISKLSSLKFAQHSRKFGSLFPARRRGRDVGMKPTNACKRTNS
jgi:hypothetical protein